MATYKQKLAETRVFLGKLVVALDAITDAFKHIPPSLPEAGKQATQIPLNIAGEYLVLLIGSVGGAYADTIGDTENGVELRKKAIEAAQKLEEVEL